MNAGETVRDEDASKAEPRPRPLQYRKQPKLVIERALTRLDRALLERKLGATLKMPKTK